MGLVLLVISGFILFLIPVQAVFRISCALAYRFTKNDQNSWVIVPTFIVQMILLMAAFLFWDYKAHVDKIAPQPYVVTLQEWLVVYAAIWIVFMVIGTLFHWIKAILSGIGGTIEGAIRGRD